MHKYGCVVELKVTTFLHNTSVFDRSSVRHSEKQISINFRFAIHISFFACKHSVGSHLMHTYFHGYHIHMEQMKISMWEMENNSCARSSCFPILLSFALLMSIWIDDDDEDANDVDVDDDDYYDAIYLLPMRELMSVSIFVCSSWKVCHPSFITFSNETEWRRFYKQRQTDNK